MKENSKNITIRFVTFCIIVLLTLNNIKSSDSNMYSDTSTNKKSVLLVYDFFYS